MSPPTSSALPVPCLNGERSILKIFVCILMITLFPFKHGTGKLRSVGTFGSSSDFSRKVIKVKVILKADIKRSGKKR